MSEEGTAVSGAPAEVATSLSRGTNWWGAFVIGLAGTILVTGIVPFAVQSMGAAAIPAIALVVVIGLIVCLCMGELAALLPHRTGRHAVLRLRELRAARADDGEAHRGRVRLGLLARLVPRGAHQHVAGRRLHRRALPRAAGSHVLAARARWVRRSPWACSLITFVGLIGLFIPCYLGIRLGARFATILGVTSMVPLTLLIILPVFKPSQLPLVEHLGLPLRQPGDVGDRLLPGLDLRHLVERHRHGGGGVLHRRMSRPGP